MIGALCQAGHPGLSFFLANDCPARDARGKIHRLKCVQCAAASAA